MLPHNIIITIKIKRFPLNLVFRWVIIKIMLTILSTFLFFRVVIHLFICINRGVSLKMQLGVIGLFESDTSTNFLFNKLILGYADGTSKRLLKTRLSRQKIETNDMAPVIKQVKVWYLSYKIFCSSQDLFRPFAF